MRKVIDKDRESLDRKIDRMVNQTLRANAPGKKKATNSKRGKKK